MLVVSLLTLGSPEQLTGGYLYHRRMAELAGGHDARIDFVPVPAFHNPFTVTPRADVILVDSIAAARVAPRTWLRAPGPPLAAILHQPPGGIDHGAVRRRVQATFDRSLYRRCVLLVAASAALADELQRHHRVPADRVRVIAPGRDVAAVASQPQELRNGRRAAFLSVGNWMARKGTLELLEAFAQLPTGAATLHLVGRDDVEPRYAVRVRDRLKQPDLTGRVAVHGTRPREDVAALYRAADVFVLPSYVEPYGTVYGEALAAGLPVVGWRAGNIVHLADDGREGVLVAPGDVDALAAALERLALDDAWRRWLADGARRRGRQLPTWAETATSFFGELRALAVRSAR
jgi:glycosyltransferase involved in cell wall biosynthesis